VPAPPWQRLAIFHEVGGKRKNRSVEQRALFRERSLPTTFGSRRHILSRQLFFQKIKLMSGRTFIERREEYIAELFVERAGLKTGSLALRRGEQPASVSTTAQRRG
jgi:hypothetical protein